MRRRQAKGRSEAGYSLVELLVVAGLMAVVLGTLMQPLILSQRIETRDTNYDAAQQTARTGLDSMVAQIRQATAFTPAVNAVVINVTLHSTGYTVEYECDIAQGTTGYRECVRAQTTQGGTLPSMSSCVSSSPPAGCSIVAQNLQNGTSTSPVFTWGPDPNAPYYMTATIQVPSSGGNKIGLTHSITLSDGALMRNLNVGN